MDKGATSNTDKGPNKKIIGAAVLSLAVGFAAGSLITGEARWRQGLQTGAEQKQEEMASILSGSGLLPPELPVNNLPGKIISVNGNTLTLEVENLNTNPFSAPSPATRTVTLAPDAAIIQLMRKPQAEFDEEQSAFFAAEQEFVSNLDNGIEAEPPVPPTPYRQEKLALSDLTPGMFVQVTSTDDAREAAAITATSLSVRDVQFDAFEEPVPGTELPETVPPAPEEPTE